VNALYPFFVLKCILSDLISKATKHGI